MTKSFLNAIIVGLSAGCIGASALPSSDLSYSCLGKDRRTGEAVVFSLLFSQSLGENVGYANEVLSIAKVGSHLLKTPRVYQIYGASQTNQCKRNRAGEIYFNADLKMEPTDAKEIAPYTLELRIDCGPEEEQLNLRAYCLFEN